ncbi:uncharacterized protein LOC112343707 [Selaginella moellendorffii]|uniref:uncharacterized protein LOC112343707 n=1 Tax=Selaginella moellendorffii TaxID=88036 RepID=UPI000D1CDF75|nr:uncharacterized protein LOC112343707 [Selaginella moellendorffii]|eukprot:XP_024523443.1 uncharacterized protein LOC112343707 [Selaginella moellendorffii]
MYPKPRRTSSKSKEDRQRLIRRLDRDLKNLETKRKKDQEKLNQVVRPSKRENYIRHELLPRANSDESVSDIHKEYDDYTTPPDTPPAAPSTAPTEVPEPESTPSTTPTKVPEPDRTFEQSTQTTPEQQNIFQAAYNHFKGTFTNPIYSDDERPSFLSSFTDFTRPAPFLPYRPIFTTPIYPTFASNIYRSPLSARPFKHAFDFNAPTRQQLDFINYSHTPIYPVNSSKDEQPESSNSQALDVNTSHRTAEQLQSSKNNEIDEPIVDDNNLPQQPQSPHNYTFEELFDNLEEQPQPKQHNSDKYVDNKFKHHLPKINTGKQPDTDDDVDDTPENNPNIEEKTEKSPLNNNNISPPPSSYTNFAVDPDNPLLQITLGLHSDNLTKQPRQYRHYYQQQMQSLPPSPTYMSEDTSPIHYFMV